MIVRVIISFIGGPKDSIWNKLAEYLGREPTQREAADEVRRILTYSRREARAGYHPLPPCPGRDDYEADLAARPFHHDGTPRPVWHELSAIARWSWNRGTVPAPEHVR